MLRAWGRALALSPGRRCFTTEQQKLLKSYASRPETSEKLRVLWTEYAKAQHAFTESSQEAQNSKDEAMRELFEASLPSVQAEVETAKTALTEALLGPVLPGCRGVILEVLAQRAGTDGADFTAWLKRMYEGLAQCKGWRTNVVDCDFTRISLPHPLAGGGEGYRHLILQFEGPDAWELLRFERGLHRLTVMSAKGPVQSTDVRVLASQFIAVCLLSKLISSGPVLGVSPGERCGVRSLSPAFVSTLRPQIRHSPFIRTWRTTCQ